MTSDNIKILFRFYSDILDAETVETMWAKVFDAEKNYYKIDNIPFYAMIASDDIVWAEQSKMEGMLTYRKTVKYSGNSTIHIIMMDNGYDIEIIRRIFSEMECESEKMNDKYFALQIPADMDYLPIKSRLDELEDNGVIGYAETCLSGRHQYKNYSPF